MAAVELRAGAEIDQPLCLTNGLHSLIFCVPTLTGLNTLYSADFPYFETRSSRKN
jgi:hypothetical protein